MRNRSMVLRLHHAAGATDTSRLRCSHSTTRWSS